MIKQILVGAIALSMTLLAACGKTSKLVNSAEIPAELTKEVAVESKPWLTETDWTILKYAAIGVGLAVVFAAGAVYGSYIAGREAYIRGRNEQFGIDQPQFLTNYNNGQQQAQAQIQALNNAHINEVLQLNTYAAQQYNVGVQQGKQIAQEKEDDLLREGFEIGQEIILRTLGATNRVLYYKTTRVNTNRRQVSLFNTVIPTELVQAIINDNDATQYYSLNFVVPCQSVLFFPRGQEQIIFEPMASAEEQYAFDAMIGTIPPTGEQIIQPN